MKIAIISGSPRTASVTRRVALYLQGWLKKNSSHEIDLIEMKDWDVPPVQTVWVTPDKAPVALQPLAEKIFNADGYILVTPEYNGSYSPAMKNLLDHFPKCHRLIRHSMYHLHPGIHRVGQRDQPQRRYRIP